MSKFYLKTILLLLLFTTILGSAYGQDCSFVVLGDLHMDGFEYHDMDYVRTRPQDFEQITKEYPYYTATYIPGLLNVVKQQAQRKDLNVKAIVQLGDIMQGVAGNDDLSRKMARFAVDKLYDLKAGVPWILTKGNHDVSVSPGQPEAWREVVQPFIERQIGARTDESMYTYCIGDDIELFVLDQFFSVDMMRPESDIIKFLKEKLPESKAKYKFLLTHQPVIPVTERCWHLFSGIRRELDNADEVRNDFLNLLASYDVTVLCAHLHKYSHIVRNTEKGPILQIMVNSVVDGFESPADVNRKTEFPSVSDFDKEWQPQTNERRMTILEQEKPYIESYLCEDRPGYGIVSLNGDKLTFKYYDRMSDTPCDSIDISTIYNR